MAISLFALAPWLWLSGTDFGIPHFTTDLILYASFGIVTALPMAFLRPIVKKWEQKGSVRSPLFTK